MKEFREFWLPIILMLFIVIGICVAVMFGVNKFNAYQCKRQANIMEKAHYYSATTNCMVLTNNGWIPLSSYYVIKRETKPGVPLK